MQVSVLRVELTEISALGPVLTEISAYGFRVYPVN